MFTGWDREAVRTVDTLANDEESKFIFGLKELLRIELKPVVVSIPGAIKEFDICGAAETGIESVV